MPYIRHDKDNNPVSPQPVSIARTFFGNNEGWTTITSYDWSGDYVARKSDNTERTPQTYQRHDVSNTPVGIGTYQRHDKDNNPIYQ